MRPAKRFWIYSGLGIPEGIALVRRPNRRAADRRIMLVGEAALAGLEVALTSLLADTRSVLHTDLRGASARQWAEHGWLVEQMETFRPSAVFLALDPRDALARQALRGDVRSAGATEVWLVPPGIPWRTTRRYIPAPELNAQGFALWASRALSVVK